MKKIILVFLGVLVFITLNSQTISDGIIVHDTRLINDAANFTKKTIRADFKNRTQLGIPGTGTYSTNLTISPWIDNTGDLIHQLSFNAGGIYYRTGNYTTWNSWQRLLMSDVNGDITTQGTIIANKIQVRTIVPFPDSDDYFYPSVEGADIVFRAKRRGTGGRAFVHDYNNILVLNYGGDFTGGVKVNSNLVVSGDLFTQALNSQVSNIDERLVVGKLFQNSNEGSVNRISILPYKHGAGPWNIISRDTPSEAFLDISYGNIKKLLSFRHNVGIGILTDNPQYPLDVAGTIRATEVKVEIAQGADYVFNPDYELKPLSEVEAFVKENKHLPDVPSEKHMQENGLNMNEFQIKLLEKIEELTLYTISQEKRLNEQQSIIEKQNKRIEQLESK